jgi:hypothetical protein
LAVLLSERFINGVTGPRLLVHRVRESVGSSTSHATCGSILADLAHAGVAEVAVVREQRGVAVFVQPRVSGCAVRVRELVAEGCPRVDVDQDLREIDLRQPTGDVRCERGRRGRPFGARQPADVQLSVLDVDRYVAGSERAIERVDALVKIAGELLEALIDRCGQPEHPL